MSFRLGFYLWRRHGVSGSAGILAGHFKAVRREMKLRRSRPERSPKGVALCLPSDLPIVIIKRGLFSIQAFDVGVEFTTNLVENLWLSGP